MVEKKTVKKSKPKKPAKPQIQRQVHKIDAQGKILGRLASEVAVLLRGKNKPSFQPYLDQGDEVVISNAAKLKITGKKLEQKKYYHYSGYPGGLKERKMGELFAKDPAQVFKKTVWNMLPKNKLRARMIKRLKVNN